MSKAGQPTKYTKDLYPKIEKAIKLGATDKEVAFLIDVNEDTLHEWKKQHKEFSEFYRECKTITDSDMEQSLRKRAMGCTTKETKVIRRFDRESDSMAVYEESEVVKEHAPDTKAIERWLFNRNPDRWKNKQEVLNTTLNEDGETVGINKNITEEEAKAAYLKLRNED